MKKLFFSVVCLLMVSLAYGQTIEGEPDLIIDTAVEYLKKESIGGKLDFNSVLEKDNKGLYLYDGVSYNKKDFAIFLWGQAVKEHAILSRAEVIQLWEEIYGRKLSRAEKKALERGYQAK